jgi:hypothetical protein
MFQRIYLVNYVLQDLTCKDTMLKDLSFWRVSDLGLAPIEALLCILSMSEGSNDAPTFNYKHYVTNIPDGQRGKCWVTKEHLVANTTGNRCHVVMVLKRS